MAVYVVAQLDVKNTNWQHEGPDHGIGHPVLSVLSCNTLWRTEGGWRYVDGC
jgi:hypothetical protein